MFRGDCRDGNVIALKENDEGFNHSTLLGVYVDDLLKENNLTANDLDAVAVSMGPGSYTGLAYRGIFSQGDMLWCRETFDCC